MLLLSLVIKYKLQKGDYILKILVYAIFFLSKFSKLKLCGAIFWNVQTPAIFETRLKPAAESLSAVALSVVFINFFSIISPHYSVTSTAVNTPESSTVILNFLVLPSVVEFKINSLLATALSTYVVVARPLMLGIVGLLVKSL